MPKLKAQVSKPLKTSITEFLDSQDSRHLVGALNTFETSEGWSLFQSFLLFQAANYAGYGLHLAQKTGTQYEAASAGAKAEILREMAETFVAQLRMKVNGNEGVVNEEVPQD